MWEISSPAPLTECSLLVFFHLRLQYEAFGEAVLGSVAYHPFRSLDSLDRRTILPAHSRTFFIKTQLFQNAHRPGAVAISTPQQLSSVFLPLQAQPALASTINTLEYNHAEVTMEQAEDGSK
jgi:hypothetical protein